MKALSGESQTFETGSQLLTQCLFPPRPLPQILDELPAFLMKNHFELLDYEMAERYRLDDPDQPYPTDAHHEWMLSVSRSGQPRFGMFFYCDAEASPLEKQPEPGDTL